jgi:hypothetical protein
MCGFVMMAVAAAVGLFAFWQHRKGKRILAAPFKKTGEVIKQGAAAADPKGMISTEGAVIQGSQPLLSPITKTPCLYYEIEIRRKWEKQERTQNGYTTRTGSDSVHSAKQGTVFSLDDGTGPVPVDASQGADTDMKKTFQESIPIGFLVPSELKFGELRINTPINLSSDSTKGYEATEKIVPADGKLFALGRLENGAIRKPGWRSMMLSPKGRDGLLASTGKKKKVGLIGSGVSAALAIPLFFFGPKADPNFKSDSCKSIIAGVQASDKGGRCEEHAYSDDGESYKWTIAKAGHYTVTVTPPKVAMPINPAIEIKKGAQDELVAESKYSSNTLTANLEPGEYKLVVHDQFSRHMEGGFSWTMDLSSDVAQDAPANGEAPAVADSNDAAPAGPLAALKANLDSHKEWGSDAKATALAKELRKAFDEINDPQTESKKAHVAVQIGGAKPRQVVILVEDEEMHDLPGGELRKLALEGVKADPIGSMTEAKDSVTIAIHSQGSWDLIGQRIGGKWTVDAENDLASDKVDRALALATPAAKAGAKTAALSKKSEAPAKSVAKAEVKPAKAPKASKKDVSPRKAPALAKPAATLEAPPPAPVAAPKSASSRKDVD